MRVTIAARDEELSRAARGVRTIMVDATPKVSGITFALSPDGSMLDVPSSTRAQSR